MRTRLAAVQLCVHTPDGALGRTVELSSGLNVIRAGNSRGKTQLVQAVIYGLGLERMLTARANAPLGSAFTSEVRVQRDGRELVRPVTSSWVAVELTNASGAVLTAQRHVLHPRYQRDLVRVWQKPAITSPDNAGRASEYFLHAPGSATHDLGFHALLAEFLSWDLPMVNTYPGKEIPLYIDVSFPFLIVDQQSWGSSGPRKVERYQIREPLRRAAEFLLALDGPVSAKRRAELERVLSDLRTSWANVRGALMAIANAVGGRAVGIPAQLPGAQTRSVDIQPVDLSEVQLQVLDDGEWVPADTVAERLADQLRQVSETPEAAVENDADEATKIELARTTEELASLLAAARLIEQDLSMSEAQLAALDRRLDSLQEERNRNVDVRTLTRLGSQAATSHLIDHSCPTCQQSLEGVETDHHGPILDLDETVALLNAQIATAQRMRERAKTVAEQGSSAFTAMQRQSDHIRARIRALEADMIAPLGMPSAGDITRRVTLQLRIDELNRARDSFADRLEALDGLAQEVARARSAMNALPEGMPAADLTRTQQLTKQMQDRLAASRFASYAASEVQIDIDTLRPTRQGFDLDIDASASDVVRIKVAYLDAIRAIGSTFGPHPGFLILDELRQQDIEPPDYAAILRYLAIASTDDRQTVVTSATPRPELDALLGTVSANIVELGDARVLQPLLSPSPIDTNVIT